MRSEREADAAEYERRLQEAVDSAEQWKQFAEGLQAKQAALAEQLAGLQAELQVRCQLWFGWAGLHWPTLTD